MLFRSEEAAWVNEKAKLVLPFDDSKVEDQARTITPSNSQGKGIVLPGEKERTEAREPAPQTPETDSGPSPWNV